ncbi:hypothetical protein HOK51_04600 [Candidatus Woesearchaeota archaeon]|jgi:hypothetical protein|nr:hypothetical protein [Candidatus Woesearchaeota archaeon]MBT6519104.1 hypothetical protein [Candidatus Woesearchaeota archaeon]MBT7367312.1 hypothetical protein [Candidatus Woesearchaeota archaeon]
MKDKKSIGSSALSLLVAASVLVGATQETNAETPTPNEPSKVVEKSDFWDEYDSAPNLDALYSANDFVDPSDPKHPVPFGIHDISEMYTVAVSGGQGLFVYSVYKEGNLDAVLVDYKSSNPADDEHGYSDGKIDEVLFKDSKLLVESKGIIDIDKYSVKRPARHRSYLEVKEYQAIVDGVNFEMGFCE